MKKNVIFSILIVSLIVLPFFAFSQTEINYPSVPGVAAPQEFIKEVESQEEILPLFMAYLFHLLLVVALVVALGIILYGGALYITSAGDPQKRKTAKTWILSTMQGTLIVLTSYALLFALDSQLVLFQQRIIDDTEKIGKIELTWEIKNVYYQIPFGLLIEDAILNDTAKNKLYDVLDATYAAEHSADGIEEGSKQLLEIIESCPEGEPCCGEGSTDSPPIEIGEKKETDRTTKESNEWYDLDIQNINTWVDEVGDDWYSEEDKEWFGELTTREWKEDWSSPVAEFGGQEGSLFAPDVSYKITSGLGEWRGSGGIWDYHQGVDITAPGNVDIYNSHEGEVVFSGMWDPETRGNTVAVVHSDNTGNSFLIIYQHLSAVEPKAGDVLQGGVEVGKMGSTGAGGHHLHYEVRAISNTEAQDLRSGNLNYFSQGEAIDPFKSGFLDKDRLNLSSSLISSNSSKNKILASLFLLKNIGKSSFPTFPLMFFLTGFYLLFLIKKNFSSLEKISPLKLKKFIKGKKNSFVSVALILSLLLTFFPLNHLFVEDAHAQPSSRLPNINEESPESETKTGSSGGTREKGYWEIVQENSNDTKKAVTSALWGLVGGTAATYFTGAAATVGAGAIITAPVAAIITGAILATGTAAVLSMSAYDYYNQDIEYPEEYSEEKEEEMGSSNTENSGGCFWSSLPPEEGFEIANESRCENLGGDFEGHFCICPAGGEKDVCSEGEIAIYDEGSLPENSEEICYKTTDSGGDVLWCCDEEESLCPEDKPVQIEGECSEEQNEMGCVSAEDLDGNPICCCSEDALSCSTIGEEWIQVSEEVCPDQLPSGVPESVECQTLGEGESAICCCTDSEFCLDEECYIAEECEEGYEARENMDNLLCCCPVEPEMCPPCPEINPPVQEKISEIEGYMDQLSNDLEVLLQTKEPIKEDLYQLYKAVMLKSLGYRQVFGYNSLILERRYYGREEVVIETDTEKTEIGPYSWDWSRWVGNILYRVEKDGNTVEENDPLTFYLRRPEADQYIEDALYLADEAKKADIQKIGKDIGAKKSSSLEKVFGFFKNFFEKTEPKNVFAQSNINELNRCIEEKNLEVTEDNLQEILDICEIDTTDITEDLDIRDIEVKSPSDYLVCKMEIPVGETFDLTWAHLIELLDTIDEYIEEGKKLIDQQAHMNSLASSCECPCEGDEGCEDAATNESIFGENISEEEEGNCGGCVLTCDLNAIKEAHKKVLQTREKLREIAAHIELLTEGHFNTPTEDLCDPLNEEIRDEEEKNLCTNGGEKLITKHELITRKLNYSRYAFDECMTRPEHLEDVLEGKRAGKMPFFGPLAEEKDLERYTKTKEGGRVVNTSTFNWFCCSDERLED